MIKSLSAAAIILSLLSAPVSAKSEGLPNDPDELVCKHHKKTNSRFTTKTCYTRAQWVAISEQNKRDYAENQSRHKIVIRRDQ